MSKDDDVKISKSGERGDSGYKSKEEFGRKTVYIPSENHKIRTLFKEALKRYADETYITPFCVSEAPTFRLEKLTL